MTPRRQNAAFLWAQDQFQRTVARLAHGIETNQLRIINMEVIPQGQATTVHVSSSPEGGTAEQRTAQQHQPPPEPHAPDRHFTSTILLDDVQYPIDEISDDSISASTSASSTSGTLPTTIFVLRVSRQRTWADRQGCSHIYRLEYHEGDTVETLVHFFARKLKVGKQRVRLFNKQLSYLDDRFHAPPYQRARETQYHPIDMDYNLANLEKLYLFVDWSPLPPPYARRCRQNPAAGRGHPQSSNRESALFGARDTHVLPSQDGAHLFADMPFTDKVQHHSECNAMPQCSAQKSTASARSRPCQSGT
eukprot:2235985-Amphidinium_carterae.1